ncbi:MAG: hypothetical protein O3B84_02220 [Chloroflexi bacterium]|nr:hypothetical protein [Chloroflexota bacterium]
MDVHRHPPAWTALFGLPAIAALSGLSFGIAFDDPRGAAFDLRINQGSHRDYDSGSLQAYSAR